MFSLFGIFLKVRPNHPKFDQYYVLKPMVLGILQDLRNQHFYPFCHVWAMKPHLSPWTAQHTTERSPPSGTTSIRASVLDWMEPKASVTFVLSENLGQKTQKQMVYQFIIIFPINIAFFWGVQSKVYVYMDLEVS